MSVTIMAADCQHKNTIRTKMIKTIDNQVLGPLAQRQSAPLIRGCCLQYSPFNPLPGNNKSTIIVFSFLSNLQPTYHNVKMLSVHINYKYLLTNTIFHAILSTTGCSDGLVSGRGSVVGGLGGRRGLFGPFLEVLNKKGGDVGPDTTEVLVRKFN